MRRLLLVLLWLLFLTGCSLIRSQEIVPEATEIAPSPTPVVTPTVEATPLATEPANQVNQQALNIWVLTEISTQADDPGGIILAEQLAAFETNHPNVTLNVERKATSGQADTLSYLRSGRDVAPSILPDLVILPADSLTTAAAEELIFPLEDFIMPEDINDLFPAANELSQTNGQIYGYPFALTNLSHMAYDPAVFTDTVPITWDEYVGQEGANFYFPAAGPSGGELALQLYFGAGGNIVSEPGQPALEVEPLATALSFFSQGRDQGFIPSQISNLTSLNETWQAFANGEAASIQTVESQYSVERDSDVESDFAQLPGIEAPLTPLVKGWTWAISTPDPARQSMAAELLNWLIAAPNIGDWSLAASKLPGRRTAFEQWPTNNPYLIFLQQELEFADPYPVAANTALLSLLSTAVIDVLTQAKPPLQAAEDTVAALQP
ncbi:MAG: extracellular solute-binding protein [Chloroflexota bacterium]|jgi:maltose-binding protein MalE